MVTLTLRKECNSVANNFSLHSVVLNGPSLAILRTFSPSEILLLLGYQYVGVFLFSPSKLSTFFSLLHRHKNKLALKGDKVTPAVLSGF